MNLLLQSSLLLPLLLGQTPGADNPDGGVAKVPVRPAMPVSRTVRPPAPVPGDTSGKAATPTPTTSITEKAVSPGADRMSANCEEVRRKARFNIYFDKVEIEKLVQTVSDATCKTFILGENIRGKISVIGPDNGRVEVSADEFYAAFLAALDANNLAVVPYGKFSKIVEKAKAKQNNIPTITDGSTDYTTNEQMITRLFKVRYVELEPLRNVVQQLVSPGGDSILFQPDTLIVNDLGGNMHRIERIIEQLDVRSANDEMRIVQIRFALAADVANTIQKLFEQKGRPGTRPATLPLQVLPTPPAPGTPATPTGTVAPTTTSSPTGAPATLTSLIPDERTNKLIIVASAAANERINDIIRQIDVPISGEGRINVYSLANATAEDIAATLQALAQGTANRPRAPTGTAAPQGAAQPTTQRPAGTPGLAATELFAGEVKISPDKATNSLVVVASQSDYRNLVRVIEKLDVPRRQVFVEAVIMEVDMTRETDLGVSLHQGFTVNTSQGQAVGILGTKYSGTSPPSFSLTNLANYGGFLAGIQGPAIPALTALGLSVPSFGLIIHALQTSAGVNVLSTPHLLTSDNEEAEITVGQNVPFQAGFAPQSLPGVNASSVPGAATSSLGAAIGGLGSYYAPISRQNVELKLNIKPQINASDYIRMVINESTEEIVSNDPVLGPTLAKRTAKTTVVAKDQETVVIGGIIQDRTIENASKVPVLGDIPVLGVLFRETTKQTIKTNLLLFLTPYIIRDSSDFRRIFERKMAERQRFVEEFYGELPRYDVAVDFDRKAGPLGKMNQASIQTQKAEAGIGLPGDQVIRPAGPPQPIPVPPPPPYSPPEVVPPPTSTPSSPAPGSSPPAQGASTEPPASSTPPPATPAPDPQAPPYDRSMVEPPKPPY
jgi:general secretion pathway protein D